MKLEKRNSNFLFLDKEKNKFYNKKNFFCSLFMQNFIILVYIFLIFFSFCSKNFSFALQVEAKGYFDC